MNWLLSANRTRLILFLAVIPFLFSCEKARDIGLGIIPPQELGIIYTDTLTIQASTVLADSVVTYGAGRLLVGQYQDPDFGKVTAKAFARLYPLTNSIEYDTVKANTVGEVVIDSLRLTLGVTAYNYGETGDVEQTFHIHRLTDSLRTSLKSGEFYTSNSTLPYEPTPVFSFSGKLKDLREKGVLHFKFSDNPSLTALGEEIAGFFRMSTPKTRDEFNKQIKGFVIVPDGNNAGGIIGITPGSLISVHYKLSEINQSTKDTSEVNKVYNFSLGRGPLIRFPDVSINYTFNNIQSERTGTALAGINTPLTPLVSSATNYRTFVEGGLGFYTKLEFPTLDKLKQQGNVAINKAELIIKPVIGSVETYPIPDYLVLHETNNSHKKQLSKLRTSNGTFEFPFIYNEGQIGSNGGERILYDSRDEVFRAVLTSHFQHLLSGDTANKGILIAPANEDITVNRLILNNQNNSPFSMKLRVYYTVFK